MTATDRDLDYLAIDPTYSARLGGLRWAYALDSIQFSDGTTFALNPELSLLLEGASHGKSLPPFAYVLTLYHRMKRGEDDPLRLAFQAVKGEPALTRNAGLLIGELCRDIPGLSTKPSVLELTLMLEADFRADGRVVGRRAEKPPLSLDEFENRIRARLEKFDDGLLHWLRHGQSRPKGVHRIAEAAESIEQRLRQLIAACRTSERLVGALTISPTMDSALTLPPRKRSRESPPQGGYQDVTTRGDPERLLPSQFALDADEFIRRFAGNELLYFEREVPHSPRRPDKILILDQGVRTWGGVRLALAAGLMTLLRPDARSFGSPHLYLTSVPGVLSLTETSTPELTRHLEASDFTPHPAACVRRVVESNDEPVPRDIVLLTHPRNLGESHLIKSLDSLLKTDRFFALSVGDAGEAELAEWQRTGFVSVRQFRVDLGTAERAKSDSVEPQTGVFPTGAWTGAVEPIPFPFGVGLIDEITLVNFDGSSERLVMVSRHGIPHSLDVTTGRVEVLPRAFHRGAVLKSVQAILPTSDGVVLVGTAQLRPPEAGAGQTILSTDPALSSGASEPSPKPTEWGRFLAAHYDFANQTVKVHDLGASVPHLGWYSYPDLNCIALHTLDSEHRYVGVAFDLTTGERFMGGVTQHVASARLYHAWNRQGEGQVAYPLSIVPMRSKGSITGKGPYLHQNGHRVQVHRWEGGPVDFEPTMDGKPLLEGATIWQARASGNVLAVHTVKQQGNHIYLFHLPSGRLMREIPWTNKPGAFLLSPSRHRVALHRGRWEVGMLNVSNASEPPVAVPRGRLHNNLELMITARPFVFGVRIGKWSHWFTCEQGQLSHSATLKRGDFHPNPLGLSASPSAFAHDPERYSLSKVVTQGGLQAVIDRFGQILLLRSTGELVALFLVRGHRAAAWIPAGVFWGDPALIGAAPHASAARLVSEAIREAVEGKSSELSVDDLSETMSGVVRVRDLIDPLRKKFGLS
jgi:hypothetical protein